MVQKRHLKDREECSSCRQRQKKSQNIETTEEFKCYLEQLLESKFNDMVKKLVGIMKNESSSNYFDHPPPRLIKNEVEATTTMYLKFTSDVKLPVFTHSTLEANYGTYINVALFDINNEKITSGSLSSVKVEIVPLLGEFGDNGNENWTEEEFCRNIAKDRPNVGPVIKGSRILDLKDGEASLMNVSFGDNSSCTQKGMYRLGVRPHESARRIITEGERIREGITSAFKVKDHHGRDNQKPHPPLLDSDIECLEKVGKGRATKLRDKGISTVRHFLQHFFTNEAGLREILEIKASDESWKKMVDHARECSLDDNHLHSYQVMDLNNGTHCNQVALGEHNLQTIPPGINLAASQENQLQDLPGSSNMPLAGCNMSYTSLINGGTDFGGSVPDWRIIQQGQLLLQVTHDSSAMNFSTQHVDTSTFPNEEALGPFFSRREMHFGTFGTDNLLDSTNLQEIFANLPPIISPERLDASVMFDHFTEMPPQVTGQPAVQPDLPDQAINLPDLRKWTKLIAVVKWKVMLSAAREKKKEQGVVSASM